MTSNHPLPHYSDTEPKDKAFIAVRNGTQIYDLEVDVEVVFDEGLQDGESENDGYEYDYDNDDFDRLCLPTSRRAGIIHNKTPLSFDDRKLALLLDHEYGTRGVGAEKTLRYFKDFDTYSNIDPDHFCAGDPAIVQDSRSGQQYYLCFSGYKALWGAKGGEIRDAQGSKLNSLRSRHKFFRGHKSTKNFRVEHSSYPTLMLIRSPRPRHNVDKEKLLPALTSALFTPPGIYGKRKLGDGHGSDGSALGSSNAGNKRPRIDTGPKVPTMSPVSDEDPGSDLKYPKYYEIADESVKMVIGHYENVIEKLIQDEIRGEIKRQVQQTVQRKLLDSGLLSPEQL